MGEHARAEAGCHYFLLGGMCSGISAALDFEAVFSEFLVFFVQPFGAGRVVWEEEDDEGCGDSGDDSFDYEQPAEAFKAGVAVEMAYAVCDTAAECAGEVGMGDDEGDAEGAFFHTVPECDKIDDTCLLSVKFCCWGIWGGCESPTWEETCLEDTYEKSQDNDLGVILHTTKSDSKDPPCKQQEA